MLWGRTDVGHKSSGDILTCADLMRCCTSAGVVSMNDDKNRLGVNKSGSLWQIINWLLLLSSSDLLYPQKRLVCQMPVWMCRAHHTRHHLHADEADSERCSIRVVDCRMPYWLRREQMILCILGSVCLLSNTLVCKQTDLLMIVS